MADGDKEMTVARTPASSSGSADTVATAKKPEVDPSQPLWRLVIKEEKAAGGGGNVHFVCTLCRGRFTGSYTRVKAHFLQIRGVGIRSCNRVDRVMLKELKNEQQAVDSRKISKKSNEPSVPFTSFEGKDTWKKRKMGLEENKTIEETFKIEERAELDRMIGRFFFSSLLPFTIARSPYWIDLVKSLANFKLSGRKISKKSNEPSVPFTSFEGKDTWKKRKSLEGNKTIEETFKIEERAELDRMIGRFFFSSLLPFTIARNPYWIDLVKSLANFKLSGYVPPTPEKLRTVLLAEEKRRIEHLLERKKFSWEQCGVSIVSYGWSDIQRQPLINFFAYSLNGPIFLKSVDASQRYKDVEFLKELFVEVIKQVGEDNVVQILTDHSPVCSRVGMSLASDPKYGHIFWTPCVRSSLNLALKNICNPSKEDADAYTLCSWIEELEQDVRNIKNFIINNQHALSIFSRYSDIKLLKAVETHFASLVIMMKRFKQIKNALTMMVTGKDWDLHCIEDNVKAQTIKKCILDYLFWEKITYFLQFTEPIWEMLREVDKEGAMLYRVYEMWGNMIEKIKNRIFKHEKKNVSLDDSKFFNHIHAMLVTRWDNDTTDLHYTAHSLNPMCYGQKWLSGGFGRVSPNDDPNVSRHMMKYLRRLFSDHHMLEIINSEFEKFSSGRYDFEVSLMARDDEDPFNWWASHGWETPNLQRLAMKLLCQPATSSYCERSKFIYSQINSVKGNKLINWRFEDLFYVHFNLQLLSHTINDYSLKPSTYWEDLDLEGEHDLDMFDIDFVEPVLSSNSNDEIGG